MKWLGGDAAWSLLAISLVGGSAAVYSMLVGRRLGEVSLGQAGLALALGLGLAQLATAGAAPASTRFTAFHRAAGDPRSARHSLRGGLVACVLLGLALAALTLLLAPRWAEGLGLAPVLVAPAALLVALQAAYIGLKAACFGLGRVAAYARLEILAALAFAAGLPIALSGDPARLLAPFLLADALFLALGLGLLVRGSQRHGEPVVGGDAPRPAPPEAAEPTQAVEPGPVVPQVPGRKPPPGDPIRYAAVATLGSAASMARLPLAVLWTGAWAGDAEAGLLQAALAFLPLVLLAPRALELALFPRLAAAWGQADPAALRRRSEESTLIAAATVSPLAGALLIAGPSLLALLFGPPFAAAAPALAGVVLAGWALGIATPAVTALAGADGLAIPNAAGLLGLLGALAVWSASVAALGATGAALGLALGAGLNAAWPILAARRRYALDLRPAAGLTALALLILAPAWLAARQWPALGLALGAGYALALAWLGLRRLRG